ncbi:MAG: DNA/RNA non-specific endonuclease [Candidatus Babeliales bacterium]|nr:DNA/RNA non-specific endonuclease [Candidatus Babeliales bacterium]
MKKSLLLTIFLMSGIWSFGQKITISYPGYMSYFDIKNEIPDSVKWTITKAHLTGVKIPRNNQFHPEKGMENLKRDYVNSHQDQGHNSPYDDNYWSKDAEYQCFSYVNMFPQRHLLNAQTWERLEDYSRQMALKYGSCEVKTQWQGIDYKMGVDSVVVPLYCIKTIRYADTVKTFKMPNRDTVIKHPFTYYKIK